MSSARFMTDLDAPRAASRRSGAVSLEREANRAE